MVVVVVVAVVVWSVVMEAALEGRGKKGCDITHVRTTLHLG